MKNICGLGLLLWFALINFSLALRIPDENEILEKWNHFNSNPISLPSKKLVEQLETRIDDRTQYQNFKSNYLKVLAHNHEFAHKKVSYQVKLNEFSKLSNDDVNRHFAGKISVEKPSGIEGLNMPAPQIQQTNRYLFAAKSFDWRDYRVVSPVKSQGSCGSCWAFSAIGAIETLYAKITGKIPNFSEQELVDCTKNAGDFTNHGCNGGYPSNGFYHAYKYGVVEEVNYPYLNKDRNFCMNDSSLQRYKISGYNYIPYGDEESLRKALVVYGPVTVAIDASDWGFNFYSSGIYNSTRCSPTKLTHAVLVVGYGTDAETGSDYWIVKNSWGTNWGLDGYILMARNQNNMCGIASVGSYAYIVE